MSVASSGPEKPEDDNSSDAGAGQESASLASWSVLNPLRILQTSIKVVPANQYAFGVVGVVAAAAVAILLSGGNWMAAVAGGVTVLAGMVVLRIFAGTQVAKTKQPQSLQTLFLGWICLLAFAIAVMFLL